jgi:hypothetical protein
MAEEVTAAGDDQLAQFKDNLAEPRFRIRLDDLVNATVRATLQQTVGERFPFRTGRIVGEDIVGRLKSYEEVARPLQAQAVLLGKWATPEQVATLTNILARVCDNCATTPDGDSFWLGLRWYPVSLLMYSAGIAALSAENYAAFAAVHTKRVAARPRRGGPSSANLVVPVVDAMREVAETNAWKCIEEYKQKRTPESEHLIKVLQPVLEDLLFLGSGYERLFDEYEILRSLIYADITDGGWGPVGRFGWKYCGRGRDDNPYSELCAEAAQQRDRWGPIQAGLFRGSYTRFEQVAAKFETELLRKLNWY